MFSDPKITINKRNEFVSKCRHQNKFRLNTFKHNFGNIDLLKHTEEGADMNAPAESTDFNINIRKLAKRNTDRQKEGISKQFKAQKFISISNMSKNVITHSSTPIELPNSTQSENDDVNNDSQLQDGGLQTRRSRRPKVPNRKYCSDYIL